MSLSLKAIDHLFSRLLATYGSEFMRRYEGQDVLAVKACWAHELAGYDGDRDRMMPIAWALENLPEKAPNAIEFRNLCRYAPKPDVPRLPEPAADPARVAQELAKLAPLRAPVVAGSGGDRAWARAIVTRHASGEKLNVTALAMARSALGQSA